MLALRDGDAKLVLRLCRIYCSLPSVPVTTGLQAANDGSSVVKIFDDLSILYKGLLDELMISDQLKTMN